MVGASPDRVFGAALPRHCPEQCTCWTPLSYRLWSRGVYRTNYFGHIFKTLLATKKQFLLLLLTNRICVKESNVGVHYRVKHSVVHSYSRKDEVEELQEW